MIKIDRQKAYDTVCWEFLEEMFISLRFLRRFLTLIMICVTSTSLYLMLNEVPTCFFKSKRGLKQGDPMSPLLFVLIMEYLLRIMLHVGKQPDFSLSKVSAFEN